VIETYDEAGYNYRMTDLQAALGLCQLTRIQEMLRQRRALAQRYSERFSGCAWLEIPTEPPPCRHNFQSYMVRLNDASINRDEMMQELLDRGVSSRRGVMAIHREKPYRGGFNWDIRLPVTSRLTESTLILPVFQGMTESVQDYVINCVEHIGRRLGSSRAAKTSATIIN
jgi:dTDP-4-amino-4,6-dideoxygalactose transaminase